MRILLTFLLTVLTVIPTLSVLAQQVDPAGLQLHLEFNGNASDRSGNGYHGTTRNITYVPGTDGTPASAALFNGTDSKVEVPGMTSVSGKKSQFTILSRIWVDDVSYRPDVAQPYIALYGLFWWHGVMQDSMMSYIRSRVRGVFSSDDQGNGGTTAFYSYNMDWCTAGIGSASAAQTSIQEMTGRWITFSMIYDKGSVSIYVDCDRIYQMINVLPVFSDHCYGSPDALTMGLVPESVYFMGFRYFKGKVDDFRIYDRALTEEEVLTYANPTCIVPKLSLEVIVPDPCFPEKIVLRDNTVATAPFVDRTWLVDGVPAGQLQEQEIILLRPGSQAVTLQYRNTLGEWTKDAVYYFAGPGPVRFLSSPRQQFRLCEGQGVTLQGNGAARYAWSPCPAGAVCTTAVVSQHPATTGTYRLYGWDAAGCADSLDFQVEVLVDTIKVWVPTAFTPNHDGRNDQFTWISRTPLAGTELRVYNRWGQEVFHSSSQTAGWDGRFGGKDQEQGTYIWRLKYSSGEGCPIKQARGVVELVR
ncbi:gliding motility-associated C-terminal domain-containing protein [Flavihumibacter petaseus]|uniref:LamG-like jellyroll fold domain-containing protein n=1 Tax=Flavihumibacter petaseus NBRC 106054 TaxID=1220578 RepID=A0A0E9N073_9BACT|nr:gliding motility-associated C-terminal domain-containing protein [Flavihumibacter petaseus]GAO42770.1 hypothetical protein FPE01S_01_17880 [Flavihumibacter petaseus NBRC 106054]